jgi:hypothetical protein
MLLPCPFEPRAGSHPAAGDNNHRRGARVNADREAPAASRIQPPGRICRGHSIHMYRPFEHWPDAWNLAEMPERNT